MHIFENGCQNELKWRFFKNVNFMCTYKKVSNSNDAIHYQSENNYKSRNKNIIIMSYIYIIFTFKLVYSNYDSSKILSNTIIYDLLTKRHSLYFWMLHTRLKFHSNLSSHNIFNFYLNTVFTNFKNTESFNTNKFDLIYIYFTYYFFKKIIKRIPHRWNPKWTRKKRNIYLRNFTMPAEDDEIEYYNYITKTTSHNFKQPTMYNRYYLFFHKFYSIYSLIRKRKKTLYEILTHSFEKLLVNNFNRSDTNLTIIPSLIYASNYKYDMYITSFFVQQNLKKPAMLKKSKHFTKYSRKISRNVIKNLSKAYIRIYIKNRINFNVKRIFKLLNLSTSSKLPHSIFRWIAPFKRKRVNVKHVNLLNITSTNNYKSLYKFNNFFPLFGLKKHLFYKYYMTFLENSSPIFTHYYNYYFLNFLENFLKSRIWFKINTTVSVPDLISKNLLQLSYTNKRDQVRIGKHLFILEMYELLWLSFFYKDLSLFAKWFKTIMEKIHYKKHKKMVKIIYNTLRLNQKLFMSLTETKGFSMDIRGKLGATGNSKKRHLAFTVGQVTMTKKKNQLHYYHILINTSTGVLGVTFFLMN